MHEKRLQEHIEGKACAWTSIHKPIDTCFETLELCTSATPGLQEDLKVKELMLDYGISKVRGGTYSQEDLDTQTIAGLEKELSHAMNRCFRCGCVGHYSNKCIDIWLKMWEVLLAKVPNVFLQTSRKVTPVHGTWIINGIGAVEVHDLQSSGIGHQVEIKEQWLRRTLKTPCIEDSVIYMTVFAQQQYCMIAFKQDALLSSSTVVIENLLSINEVLQYITSGSSPPLFVPPMSKLYIYQMGAGNGKTYKAVRLFKDDRFHMKDTFVYVTKANSAKDVLWRAFNGIAEYNIEHVELKNSNQYVARIESKTFIFGTVDSLMFAYGKKDHKVGYDFFGNIAASVRDAEHVAHEIRYAGKKRSARASWLLIGDEMQDVEHVYTAALQRLSMLTRADVAIFGDMMQSVYILDNSFIHLSAGEAGASVETISIPPVNICRRFGKNCGHSCNVWQFGRLHANMVNSIVRFDHPEVLSSHIGAALPTVTPFQQCQCFTTNIEGQNLMCHSDVNPNDAFSFVWANAMYKCEVCITNKKHDNKDNNYCYDAKREEHVQNIIDCIHKQCQQHMCLPEDFLFVFSYVRNNALADSLELEIQEFWIKKFEDEVYAEHVHTQRALRNKNYKKESDMLHVVMHKSEGNRPINTTESDYATRMVSIHASKGDDRAVVFFLQCTDSTLKQYTCGDNDLQYESMLHVGITRQMRKLYIGIDEMKGCPIRDRFELFFSSIGIRVPPPLTVGDIRLEMKIGRLNEGNMQDVSFSKADVGKKISITKHRDGQVKLRVANLNRSVIWGDETPSPVTTTIKSVDDEIDGIVTLANGAKFQKPTGMYETAGKDIDMISLRVLKKASSNRTLDHDHHVIRAHTMRAMLHAGVIHALRKARGNFEVRDCHIQQSMKQYCKCMVLENMHPTAYNTLVFGSGERPHTNESRFPNKIPVCKLISDPYKHWHDTLVQNIKQVQEKLKNHEKLNPQEAVTLVYIQGVMNCRNAQSNQCFISQSMMNRINRDFKNDQMSSDHYKILSKLDKAAGYIGHKFARYAWNYNSKYTVKGKIGIHEHTFASVMFDFSATENGKMLLITLCAQLSHIDINEKVVRMYLQTYLLFCIAATHVDSCSCGINCRDCKLREKMCSAAKEAKAENSPTKWITSYLITVDKSSRIPDIEIDALGFVIKNKAYLHMFLIEKFKSDTRKMEEELLNRITALGGVTKASQTTKGLKNLPLNMGQLMYDALNEAKREAHTKDGENCLCGEDEDNLECPIIISESDVMKKFKSLTQDRRKDANNEFERILSAGDAFIADMQAVCA